MSFRRALRLTSATDGRNACAKSCSMNSSLSTGSPRSRATGCSTAATRWSNLGEVIGKQDTILLGRGTYDYWVDFWPTATMEPFASFINGTPKHVFTSSEPATKWAGSIFVDTAAVDHVTELKQESGGDIGIHGSISLAQSLLEAELVDELRLVIAPTVAGSGRRLFGSDAALQRFSLTESQQTSTGLMLLGYARSVHGG